MSKMAQSGVLVLVKKRDVKASDAKGIKIVSLRDDGSPDYAGGASIVWMDALKALLDGRVYSVPVFFSPPYVHEQNGGASKPEGVDV